MQKPLKLAAPVQGIAEGGTATCDLAIGPRYFSLMLKAVVKKASGTPVLADILGTLRVKLNGLTVREITATRLDTINTQYGAEFAANSTDDNSDTGNHKVTFYLPIFFAEPWRKSYAAVEAMAWPTVFTNGSRVVSLNSFQLEFEVPADAGAVLSLQAIEVYAETDSGVGGLDSNGNPVLNISHWKTLSWNYGAAGQTIINTLEKAGLYQEIHFFTTTDTITDVEVEVDGAIKHKAPKAVNDLNLVTWGMYESGLSATRFDLIFDRSDFPVDALNVNGVKDFQVKPTLSGTSSTTMTMVTMVFKSAYKG